MARVWGESRSLRRVTIACVSSSVLRRVHSSSLRTCVCYAHLSYQVVCCVGRLVCAVVGWLVEWLVRLRWLQFGWCGFTSAELGSIRFIQRNSPAIERRRPIESTRRTTAADDADTREQRRYR
jgi:hypothetical protein